VPGVAHYALSWTVSGSPSARLPAPRLFGRSGGLAVARPPALGRCVRRGRSWPTPTFGGCGARCLVVEKLVQLLGCGGGAVSMEASSGRCSARSYKCKGWLRKNKKG